MAYLYMFGRLWHYAGREKWKILAYLFLHLISQLGVLAQPYAFAQVFNVLQRNEPDLIRQVIFWLGMYVLFFFVFNIFHRLARFIERRVAYRCRQRFINEMYTRLYHLPMKWHSDHHSGNTINRVNVASTGLSDFGQNQYNYVEYFMQFWGPLIILIGISYETSLMALGITLVTMFIIYRFDKILVPIFREKNEVLHNFSATFFDYVSNIKTIITLRLGKQTAQELDQKFGLFYPHLTRELQWNQVKCFLVSFCVLLLEVGVIFYYIWRQEQLGLPIMIGTVAAVFQYLRQLSGTYFDIAGNYYDIVRWQTDFQSIQPIVEAYAHLDGSSEQALPRWNKIAISRLNFSYNGGKKQLQDVSLELTAQAKIALVGESGSGKSTVLNVLRGLYEAPEARLRVDGRDYQGVSVLAGITTLVPQDPEIFENTILYNISVGIRANPPDITEAVNVACFDKVLARLPLGLHTDIREKGVNLSGGEKQRLALARGIFAAKNSSILLLDEPTSSVDAHNELIIYENIFRKYQDRCVVSSVHRLHLLDLFDMVYVFEYGKVVQRGTFRELCSQEGSFAKLWRRYQREMSKEAEERQIEAVKLE
jgi:ATP-binding cassette subfamily B protein